MLKDENLQHNCQSVGIEALFFIYCLLNELRFLRNDKLYGYGHLKKFLLSKFQNSLKC